MKKLQLFVMNAMIMTATSLLMSGVGVWFSLYISNRIGAAGMGVFQLIMSVYSFTVTFAASGINLAATRLVAEETAAPGGNVKGAVRRCLVYSLAFGAAAGVLLFTCAPFIGARLLGCAETIRPLRAMALSMPLISMSSALGGYFTAVSRVVKSASSQVLEQFLKITLAIFALTFLMPDGLEYAFLAITCSGVVAEGASFLCALLLYLLDSRRFRRGGPASGGLTGRLLGIALPVAMSSYLRSGLATVKNLLVPVRLQAGGLTGGAAFSVFGAVHGVALPVILFPAAFLNSFSSLIVPEVAQRHSRGQGVSHLIQRMLSMNLFCSLGVCGVLFCFSREIGAIVSPNPDVGAYIRLLAPVIPVMYLDTCVDCILKGMDEQLSVMRYNVVDAFASMLLVYFLLPVLGIRGYILVICLSEVFNFSLSVNRLARVAPFRFDLTERVVKPVLCIALAVAGMRILSLLGPLGALPGLPHAAVLTGGSALLYLLLLRLSGCHPYSA